MQDPVVNGKKKVAPFRLNQFGGSLGGPLLIPKLYNGSNRTFWFFDYEGLRSRRYSNFIGQAIPTRYRGGDFSTLTTATGTFVPIFDPNTYDASTGLANAVPRKRDSGRIASIPSRNS